jgi:hypothetical protein
MKQTIYTLLHLFHPAGMKPLQFRQVQSVFNVQPHYNAVAMTAKENDQMNKKFVLTVLIVLVTLTLAACAPRVTSRVLSPEEGAAYAAEVDDMVENMLIGLSENDWTMFSRDFHKDMLAEMESIFQQYYDESIGVIGAYQSKTLDYVVAQGKYRILYYNLVFENDPDVTIQVYIYTPSNQISGLGFNHK